MIKFDQVLQDSVVLFYPQNILSGWSHSVAYLGSKKTKIDVKNVFLGL